MINFNLKPDTERVLETNHTSFAVVMIQLLLLRFLQFAFLQYKYPKMSVNIQRYDVIINFEWYISYS